MAKAIDFAHAPFGKLAPLAVLKTNPDGAGIVQAIGPLKDSRRCCWSRGECAFSEVPDRYRSKGFVAGGATASPLLRPPNPEW